MIIILLLSLISLPIISQINDNKSSYNEDAFHIDIDLNTQSLTLMHRIEVSPRTIVNAGSMLAILIGTITLCKHSLNNDDKKNYNYTGTVCIAAGTIAALVFNYLHTKDDAGNTNETKKQGRDEKLPIRNNDSRQSLYNNTNKTSH